MSKWAAILTEIGNGGLDGRKRTIVMLPPSLTPFILRPAVIAQSRDALKASGDLYEAVNEHHLHPEKLNEMMKAASLVSFHMGKWRSVYDADMEEYKLGDFFLSTNSATTNLSSSKDAGTAGLRSSK